MKAFLPAAALLLLLGGCAGAVMGLSAAASVVSLAKNVFDYDVSIHQDTAGEAKPPLPPAP